MKRLVPTKIRLPLQASNLRQTLCCKAEELNAAANPKRMSDYEHVERGGQTIALRVGSSVLERTRDTQLSDSRCQLCPRMSQDPPCCASQMRGLRGRRFDTTGALIFKSLNQSWLGPVSREFYHRYASAPLILPTLEGY